MTKNDMRWRRTERNLMEAFGKALRERPVEKISVTALARSADINKATFYLHYRDVYDLAEAFVRQTACAAVERMEYLEEFVSAPETFAAHFVEDLDAQRDEFAPLLENGFMPVFMDQFVESMSEALARLCPTPADGVTHRILLTFITSGFLTSVAHFADSNRDELVKMGGHLLAGMQEYGERHFGPLEKL